MDGGLRNINYGIAAKRERLTAHGGLALMAEFNHGIGLRELVDWYLPVPGSNQGFNPSVMVDTLVLMLQGGGRSLEDLMELKNEEGLMKVIGLIDQKDWKEPVPGYAHQIAETVHCMNGTKKAFRLVVK